MNAKYFTISAGALKPTKSTKNSAGFDLYSCEWAILSAGARSWINTGIGLVLPQDVYGRIAGRSGLAGNGIDAGAGVIDSDYRGAIKVLLINNTNEPFTVLPGDRIAQLILEKISSQEELEYIIKPIDITERGENGFGSTEKRWGHQTSFTILE